ncbi:MAG: PD-(D/E)XK nuclease family protein [Psychrobacter sp.]|nr:PD-(D/E)XK nuclease family protein [Psychrobacter sp.]
MNINQLKQLLEHIKTLPSPELPEQTLFSIGGRGYYENPTSDILAFFCNSEGAHGLGNLMMEALFDALHKLNTETLSFDDLSVITEPEREVSTKGGKRIDLLLEGNEWVMVIENKIYHQQNNPFKNYQCHIQSQSQFQGKVPIYIILSPKGGAPEGWHSLSYPQLLDSLKEKLAYAFIDQPLNKWLVLLREFILHIENIMFGRTMPLETMDYVLENIRDIKQAQDLKQKVVNALQNELLQQLQSFFPERTVSTRLHHWHGYPAIRFRFEEWTTNSDVVLFLDGRKDKLFCVNYFIFDIANQQQRDQVDNIFYGEDCTSPWNEGANKIRGYNSPIENFNKTIALERLIHKLSLLDAFETEVRSQW